jgi:hypothetical protein
MVYSRDVVAPSEAPWIRDLFTKVGNVHVQLSLSLRFGAVLDTSVI